MKRCPVCEIDLGRKAVAVCLQCGFDELDVTFSTEEQYQEWWNTRVEPKRRQWEAMQEAKSIIMHADPPDNPRRWSMAARVSAVIVCVLLPFGFILSITRADESLPPVRFGAARAVPIKEAQIADGCSVDLFEAGDELLMGNVKYYLSDAQGKQFDRSLFFGSFYYYGAGTPTATLSVEGKYDSFTGWVAIKKEYRDAVNIGPSSLGIFLDGVLVKRIEMSDTSKAVYFSIDIAGCDEITIKAYPGMLIGDPCLHG